MPPVVTFTTDFGTRDPFVGIMKGVVLNRAPSTQLVDITHEIEPQNISQAARVVETSWTWFPTGTIHVVVVDPGVGSARRPIVIQNKKHYFIGPDNGVLSPALGPKAVCYELTGEKYFLKPVSATFHGRDIFASVAGWMAKGTPLRQLGKKIDNPTTLDLPQPGFDGTTLTGEIIHVDHFGNLMSNINQKILVDYFGKELKISISLGRRRMKGLLNSYSQGTRSEPGALVGSWNTLEIFCREGNAAQILKSKVGAKVRVKLLN